MPPRVAVLVSTYNDEPFLAEAIDSVLAQTYAAFELVIVNDASTDRSRDIAAAYDDARIRLIDNGVNLGLGRSLNRALATIGSEYVARLDGNDVCFPRRLERQVAYLDAHPEIAVVGAQAAVIDVEGRRLRSSDGRRPVSELALRWHRIFGNPLIHSAVMFRRAVVWDLLGGYDERYRFGEDFDLWDRMAKSHAIRNLPDTLVAYRFDPRSVSADAAARAGYRERKIPRIHANLREELRWDDVPLRWAERWVDLVDPAAAPTADDVREAVMVIERCAERFLALHPDATGDREIAARTAWMLLRALDHGFSFALWWKIFRCHAATALRVPVRLWRARRHVS